MTFELSPSLGVTAMKRAFSRFAHVIGYLCLIGAGVGLLGYQTASPTEPLWPVLAGLIATGLALALLDRRPTVLRSVVYLGVGGASLYWFSLVLFARVTPVTGTDDFLITLVKVALILVAGAGLRSVHSAGWTFAGYVVGEVAAGAAALQASAAIRFDVSAVAVTGAMLLIFLMVGMTRAKRLASRPRLAEAALDERASELRYSIEVKAAALMHDTVLGHLAAVAVSPPGPLRPDLRRAIERDLEILIGEEWLNDVQPLIDSQARSDWRRSSLMSAVREAREQPLRVDVTGDLSAVGRLSPERDSALGLAVKQCLVNVALHANTDRAEVVIIGSDRDVSVMVIDAGSGFTEAQVASDRLGLRQSVRQRIDAVGGDVQLWSTPGRGTSVMLRLPASTPLTERIGALDV